jgi:hypothetical protein
VEDGLSADVALDHAWREARVGNTAMPEAPLTTRLFTALRSEIDALPTHEWPSLERLNALAAQRNLGNARGAPIRFVEPSGSLSAMSYETQIASTGEIPTRNNWHDLLNALQWLAFPQMKSAISEMHAKFLASLGEAEAKSRSKSRDVLTMFDESGIIVASQDESLLQLVRDFQWRTLFVERREDVMRDMTFLLVGHGLLEKSLAPFIGITAKAMLLNVDRNADLDLSAADWLRDESNLASSRMLAPLPILGIPGWDARNEDATFYDNVDYFRPGRIARA